MAKSNYPHKQRNGGSNRGALIALLVLLIIHLIHKLGKTRRRQMQALR